MTTTPLAALGRRAQWVDETALAWPGAAPSVLGSDEPASFALLVSPDGGIEVSDGVAAGPEGMQRIPLRVLGPIGSDGVGSRPGVPQLGGALALSLLDDAGAPALDRAGVEAALRAELAVVRSEPGRPELLTGVQTAALLDELYPSAVDAPLGATFGSGAGGSGGEPSFAVWAPTARDVALLLWPSDDPTGSAPLAPVDPVVVPAARGRDGRWTVGPAALAAAGIGARGAQYLWRVEVLVPEEGRVVVNEVTDPWCLALTVGSVRSVAVDLADPALAPEQWARTEPPRVRSDAARTIYELHLRDFSAGDATVPAAERGTYRAFTEAGSDGMRRLAALADAGVDTIHLLPTFDIATIEEDRDRQRAAQVPQAAADSAEQQAAVSEAAYDDAYNWGYDPWHFLAPEGSYATAGHQDGGARTREFREMVGSLHATGLQVVLDLVLNHTAADGQDERSNLDRIVPGYYHRLDSDGDVYTSTCCPNTAGEHAMMERLMVDTVVTWARWYRGDGFRFDLMGHHPLSAMRRMRAALDALTPEADGVDGKAVYLYGEGWEFGEIAGDALFPAAVQRNLAGTGIGSFNDRLRDAVNGGGPFDPDPRDNQGLGTGLATAPNGRGGSAQDQEGAARRAADVLRVSLAGNLRDFELLCADGQVRRGEDVDAGGRGAAYGDEPAETVSYVDAHDNEALFDIGAYKLPAGLPMEERVRMALLSLACVVLGQSPAFWAAGTDLLRSKSLDRDSYESGDWFNAIDWSMTANGFGKGLPPASRNERLWPVMAPLLADDSLRPEPGEIASAAARALDLLRLRRQTPLLTLGSAALIRERVSFPNAGPLGQPGVVDMLIDGRGLPDEAAGGHDAALVVLNFTGQDAWRRYEGLAGSGLRLHPVEAEGADDVVRGLEIDGATGAVRVPRRTAAVLVVER